MLLVMHFCVASVGSRRPRPGARPAEVSPERLLLPWAHSVQGPDCAPLDSGACAGRLRADGAGFKFLSLATHRVESHHKLGFYLCSVGT